MISYSSLEKYASPNGCVPDIRKSQFSPHLSHLCMAPIKEAISESEVQKARRFSNIAAAKMDGDSAVALVTTNWPFARIHNDFPSAAAPRGVETLAGLQMTAPNPSQPRHVAYFTAMSQPVWKRRKKPQQPMAPTTHTNSKQTICTVPTSHSPLLLAAK